MSTANASETYTKCGDEVSDFEVVSWTNVLVSILVGNILGNSAVCWVVCNNKHLEHETRNIFIGSLAFSDLSMTFVIAYRIVSICRRKQLELGNSCDYFSTFAATLVYVSILNLFLLSLDRYIAVLHPLRYKTIVTDRFAKISLVVIWLTPTISVVLVPFVLGTEKQGSSFRSAIIGCSNTWTGSSRVHKIHMALNVSAFLVGPFLFMLAAHGRIIKVAWYQSRREDSSPGRFQQGEEQRRQEKRPKREMKWVKAVGIVVGVFTICFIPAFAAPFVRVRLGTNVPCWLFTVSVLAVHVNSALNPLIYALRSREYKQTLWKSFGRRFRNRRLVPVTTVQSQRTNPGHEQTNYRIRPTTTSRHSLSELRTTDIRGCKVKR